MSESGPENLCHSCVGACCRADAKLTMALDSQEVENLEAADTVLIEFLPADDGIDWGNRRYFSEHAIDQRKFVRRAARRLQPGQGIYGLKSDCGFLEEDDAGAPFCSVHDDSDLKPKVCEAFRPGSRTCLDTRSKVINMMIEDDSLLPNLVEAALGESELQTVS